MTDKTDREIAEGIVNDHCEGGWPIDAAHKLKEAIEAALAKAREVQSWITCDSETTPPNGVYPIRRVGDAAFDGCVGRYLDGEWSFYGLQDCLCEYFRIDLAKEQHGKS